MANLVKVNTPIGKLMWVTISGRGKKNFNEDGYDYTASIVISAEDSEELRATIKEFYDNNRNKSKKPQTLGYVPCTEEGNVKDENGDRIEFDEPEYYIFRFKTKTTYKDGKDKKISVYNSVAKKVDIGDALIANGSIGSISGNMSYYYQKAKEGVSLWLNAIQLIKFIEYVEDAGFEAVETEDGFVSVVNEETGFISVGNEEIDNETSKAKEANIRL